MADSPELQMSANVKKLSRQLDKMRKAFDERGTDIQKLLARVGILMVHQHQKWVDRELDVNMSPFKPLSPGTANRRRRGASGSTRRGYDHILRDYGTMLGSLGMKITGNEVRVGPRGKLEQAKGWGHQLGEGTPKREWLGYRDPDYAEIRDEFLDWYEGLNDGR